MSASEHSTTEADDVVAFLQSRHREVEQLFSQLVTGAGETNREPFLCLVRLLATHETAEEEVVYPALRSTGPEGGRVAHERNAEEDLAKKALADLEKIDVTGEGFTTKLEAFRRMVLDHARNEEREVFPRLRQSFDPDQLRSMRSAVQTAERMAPTHPHPRGPESAAGNLLVGPFVALADKVRDAIRGAGKH